MTTTHSRALRQFTAAEPVRWCAFRVPSSCDDAERSRSRTREAMVACGIVLEDANVRVVPLDGTVSPQAFPDATLAVADFIPDVGR